MNSNPRKRKALKNGAPRCIIIAGPNGAGKTPFAQEFLPSYAKVVHFVNADLIAGGLSPLRPESATIAAGRLFLKECRPTGRQRCGLCLREHSERSRLSPAFEAMEGSRV